MIDLLRWQRKVNAGSATIPASLAFRLDDVLGDLAMTPDQFREALAIDESDDNPRAYGDEGLALTMYQVHPAWLWDQIQRFKLRPGVRESWSAWVGRYVIAWATLELPTMDPVHAAMYFHLGHRSDPAQDDWDKAYAARFTEASAKVLGSAS